MPSAPTLHEQMLPPQEVIDAARHGDLVVFVGSGPSINVGYPSWSKLANCFLERLRMSGVLNFSDIEQLKILHPREKLSIAHLLGNEHNIDLKAQDFFQKNRKKDTFYDALNAIGCTCVTTNYDEMINPKQIESANDSMQPSSEFRVFKAEQFYPNLLDQLGRVIHLHGVADNPGSMPVQRALNRIGMRREDVAGSGPVGDRFGHGSVRLLVRAGRKHGSSFGSSHRLAACAQRSILSRKPGSLARTSNVYTRSTTWRMKSRIALSSI